MQINEESTSDDNEVKDVVKLRGKINSKDEKHRREGIKYMNDLMQPYKRSGNLDKIDIYLLQGIYEMEPDRINVSDEGEGEDFGFSSMKSTGSPTRMMM